MTLATFDRPGRRIGRATTDAPATCMNHTDSNSTATNAFRPATEFRSVPPGPSRLPTGTGGTGGSRGSTRAESVRFTELVRLGVRWWAVVVRAGVEGILIIVI